MQSLKVLASINMNLNSESSKSEYTLQYLFDRSTIFSIEQEVKDSRSTSTIMTSMNEMRMFICLIAAIRLLIN